MVFPLTYTCERCGHHWAPRVLPLPNICPRCKSRYWDEPRRNRQGLRPEKPTRRRKKKAA
jgi:hypothetical protein